LGVVTLRQVRKQYRAPANLLPPDRIVEGIQDFKGYIGPEVTLNRPMIPFPAWLSPTMTPFMLYRLLGMKAVRSRRRGNRRRRCQTRQSLRGRYSAQMLCLRVARVWDSVDVHLVAALAK
jgi:hypothetical protein